MALTRFERRALSALADHLHPGGRLGPRGGERALSDRVERSLDALPWRERTGWRILLVLFHVLPLLLIRAPHSFSRLDDAGRERYVEAWRRHRWHAVRAAFLFLKCVVGFAYYDDDRVRAAIGRPDACAGGGP